MSLISETNRQEYNCTGVTTFAIPFYFILDADVTVYRKDANDVITELVLTTDYSLVGAGVPAGGTLTTVATYSDGMLIAARDVAYTQELDISQGDGFRPDTLELSLDRTVMQVQQLSRKVERSFKLSDADTSGASLELPAPVANNTIVWADDGKSLANASPLTFATLVQASNFTTDNFTDGVGFTSGVSTQLALSSTPGVKQNTQIYFDGVYQSKSGYSLSGNIITFSDVIIASVVEVLTIIAVTQGSTAIANGAVDTLQMADGSVTLAKLNAAIKPSTRSTILSAPVSLAVQNTFYDGPSVILPVGTWILFGVVNVSNTVSNRTLAVKLWNGASAISSVSEAYFSASHTTQLFGSVVVAAGTETWKMSVSIDSAAWNATILSTSNIVAIKQVI